MKIKVLATGSSGNAIIVTDNREQWSILLDAGIPYQKIRSHSPTGKFSGVFITHEHLDHCKAVPELLRRGRPVYASPGTIAARGWIGARPIYPGIQMPQPWGAILAFDVEHDAAQPVGFLFAMPSAGPGSRLETGIYITDTAQITHRFGSVAHWIIECNHDEQAMIESHDNPALARRIENNHLSLETLKRFFKLADTSHTRSIHLVHASHRNLDPEKAIDEIQRQTGVPVYLT